MSPLGKLLKWITFAFEAFLALPLVGGLFVVANGWAPLGIAFVLHAIAVVVILRDRGPIIGNALGIITSIVALIPFVGWVMHAITAIVLLVEGIFSSQRRNRYYP
ncbi:hypothetical protein GCM10010912_07370 [Paenibacillus albidus]|uniref:Uncharacterized protein n=1 Tax=Paenibacillus albidus TaxID=2041023 RepID=A0A917BZU0_9BACL|nr:hypothetical protein [Paenibacillus albidus]MBT2289981.1 hypothetical protein [Paenibacillus albidus]GGF64920.1 hypothetical protein GCM10010912_07370 [Paenibacillus albidus]